jgi:hypothetical protein
MSVLRILLTDKAAFSVLRLPYSYATEILSSCVLLDVVSNLADVSDLMISTRKLSLSSQMLEVGHEIFLPQSYSLWQMT